MKNLNLLLANPDRRVNTLIEVMIRDLCYNRAIVNVITVTRLDEFTDLASRHDFDLAIVAPDSLRPPPKHAASPRLFPDAIRQIRERKNHYVLPILAMAVSPQNEMAVTSTGVDCVLGLPFRFDDLKSAVRSFWNLPEETIAESETRGVLAALWQRSLQRLTTLW
jgi:DNA-binding NarL/FixJ family response regulator